jgi:two-component system KDP operon response regulator KdpE
MSYKYKILVIEDESNILNVLKTILITNEYSVVKAENGVNGKFLFNSHLPDLVILDLGLPDMDGNEIIRYIRDSSQTPIIVLSARMDESDKVKALDLGANDYITKPFGTDELLARVRAALRNSKSTRDIEAVSKMRLQDMIIDFDKRKISLHNEEIKLTHTEYKIVELLILNLGKVLTYNEIIKNVWGYYDEGSVKKLQVNIANARKKLNEKPGHYNYILNELAVGYRMNDIDVEKLK